MKKWIKIKGRGPVMVEEEEIKKMIIKSKKKNKIKEVKE